MSSIATSFMSYGGCQSKIDFETYIKLNIV